MKTQIREHIKEMGSERPLSILTSWNFVYHSAYYFWWKHFTNCVTCLIVEPLWERTRTKLSRPWITRRILEGRQPVCRINSSCCLYSMIFLFEKHINSMGDSMRSNVVFWYQEKFLYSGRIFVHFEIFIYFCTHSQSSSKKFFYYSVCWYLKCELCNGMGLSLRISDVHIINWGVWIHAFCHCSFRKLVRLVSNYCLITRTNFTICMYIHFPTTNF